MHVENVVIAHSEAVKDIISVVVCSALCSVGCGCVSENVSAPFVRAYKIIYQSKLHWNRLDYIFSICYLFLFLCMFKHYS